MVVSTVLTGLTGALSTWSAESGVGCGCGGCGVAVPEGRADADREIQHRKLELTEARGSPTRLPTRRLTPPSSHLSLPSLTI
ncbi:hypothetical protein DFH94DRAFT_486850 [Russula ochroleuca]|uniref:Secreted protein n=1 Tax=Russula ochroleuca TaxID=152965 RepID=A0A9P5T8A9_9AGAM|nr:hypothetical protein DFH94DRAFT_486850 [Russula ochroleuca]